MTFCLMNPNKGVECLVTLRQLLILFFLYAVFVMSLSGMKFFSVLVVFPLATLAIQLQLSSYKEVPGDCSELSEHLHSFQCTLLDHLHFTCRCTQKAGYPVFTKVVERAHRPAAALELAELDKCRLKLGIASAHINVKFVDAHEPHHGRCEYWDGDQLVYSFDAENEASVKPEELGMRLWCHKMKAGYQEGSVELGVIHHSDRCEFSHGENHFNLSFSALAKFHSTVNHGNKNELVRALRGSVVCLQLQIPGVKTSVTLDGKCDVKAGRGTRKYWSLTQVPAREEVWKSFDIDFCRQWAKEDDNHTIETELIVNDSICRLRVKRKLDVEEYTYDVNIGTIPLSFEGVDKMAESAIIASRQ